MEQWLLYGAYGYSGRLILEELARLKLPMPVIAGRDGERLKKLADKYGAEWIAFELGDIDEVRKHLRGKKAVLHAAGPFSKTFQPMVEACLREHCHYLDITGEVDVFQRVYECDFRAKTFGVILLPGVGFDVVPTDCVAATLKASLPTATHLELAFASKGKISHGTLKTVIENLAEGGLIREKEALVYSRPGALTRMVAFGNSKPQLCMAIPWGDLASAYRTTGIPNIVVYTAVPPKALWMTRAMNVARPLLSIAPTQKALNVLVDRFVDGPSEQERETGRCLIWGEARDKNGAVWRATARTSDGYTFTARSAVAAVTQVINGSFPPGAATPSQIFGKEFLEAIDPKFKITAEQIS